MPDWISFSCAGVVLLRAPAQSLRHAAVTHADIVEGDADEISESVGYLRSLARDELLREAVGVSSPSLARRWDEILRGEKDRASDVRRVVRALTAYRLRMATRCTPFGLMAGVAVARFADTAESVQVRVGTAHRKAVRLERGWITALAASWTTGAEVLNELRVSANNLCRVRGDRLALSYLPLEDQSGDAAAPQDGLREVNVRHTDAVRAALEAVRDRPLRYPELRRRLAQRFPAAPTGAVDRMLGELIRKEFLLTDLRPPAETPDAGRYVLDALAAVDPSEFPGPAALGDVVRSLSDYAAAPLGQGHSAWRDIVSRMRRLRPAQRGVQVDLALDASVRLPPAVAAEAERAADLLWRIAPDSPGSTALDEYHREFVERYGTGRAVSVTELLDPDAGLGAPAGYAQPPSARTAPPVPSDATERDRLMMELAQEALLSGADEVVVDEDVIERAARFTGGSQERRPPSAELFAQLLATSVEALREGEFRLVLTGGAVGSAVSTFGRFAYLLPDETRASLAQLAEAGGGDSAPDALRAQLVFQARHGRGDNVAQVPRLLEHIVPVGVFADASEPGTLPLEHLAVTADARRLRIVETGSGREVLPTVLHRLNTHSLAPNAVRLLAEIGRGEVRGVHWDWGQAGSLPYVPRVRYGRVVLAPARWRPSEALRDQDAPFGEWADAVHAWRKRWQVPDRICSVYTDQRLELDLTRPLHLRLLRHELKRRPATVVQEPLDPDGSGAGWLTGPDGPHRNELVIPLVARPAPDAPAERPAAPPRREPGRREPARPSPRRQHDFAHAPGGEWLYATVHCTAARHDELLARPMNSLLAELPEEVDRWFFIRYRDPDDHLRLRFHGTPEALSSAVLPNLHRWAATLRANRLIRGFGLRTYDPELERYGGPEAIAAAERFFHADSTAALEALALRESGRLSLEPVLIAAAGQTHLARTFWSAYDTAYDGPYDTAPAFPNGREPSWISRVLDTVPRGAMHRAFQERRREALDLVDAGGSWEGLRARPGGEELLAAWQARAAALTDYAHILRDLGDRGWTPATSVFLSLLHMHHNRLIGINPEAEQAATAIMRGALQAHRDRVRNTT
ncbi:lantibiotic dehydratase [Streptomyces varsoviensis]|uniref:lantibiotic dehydratase n=1 Tax=Streptomyces varsoviensis TaxID=67373 RepID=UPI00340D78E3